jgi:hypothetical protein
VGVGVPFAIAVSADGLRERVALGDGAPQPLSWTPGRSWVLLVSLPSVSELVARTLDMAWIALLYFPASFWARRQRVCWLGIAGLFVMLASLPLLDAFIASPPREWFAAVVGVLAGLWCSRHSDA